LLRGIFCIFFHFHTDKVHWPELYFRYELVLALPEALVVPLDHQVVVVAAGVVLKP
jgi:hypothetical protein